MTTRNNQRIYPGVLNADLEIFKTDGGLKVMSNGSVFCFNHIPSPHYYQLKEKLESEPEAHAILKEWHPESAFTQLKKFAECRFGGLDYTPDISNGVLQDGEYWPCPMRGTCKGEGVVCKALKYKGQALSNADIQLMQLLSTNKTNDHIAQILDVSLGQYHKIKKELYQKLDGVQTKQEVTAITLWLNLI